MASSKTVPRLLQQQPRHDTDREARRQQQAGTPDFQAPTPWGRAAGSHKGDLRTQLEASKPSKEREVGDLESSERETHGNAGR